MSRKQRPGGEPDIEIGATARARRLRFRRKPEVEVEFEGRTRVRSDERIEDVELESDSQSARRNLPDEVEPGVTYRDVEVGWAAGARAVMPEGSDLDEGDEEEEEPRRESG
jgi:hypothetical protein